MIYPLIFLTMVLTMLLLGTIFDPGFWEPLPYLWCNECDGELERDGWCNICRRVRPH